MSPGESSWKMVSTRRNWSSLMWKLRVRSKSSSVGRRLERCDEMR